MSRTTAAGAAASAAAAAQRRAFAAARRRRRRRLRSTKAAATERTAMEVVATHSRMTSVVDGTLLQKRTVTPTLLLGGLPFGVA